MERAAIRVLFLLSLLLLVQFIFVNTIKSLHLTFSEEVLDFLLCVNIRVLLNIVLVLVLGCAVGLGAKINKRFAELHIRNVRVLFNLA